MLKIKRKWNVEKEYMNIDIALLAKETHPLAASWVYY